MGRAELFYDSTRKRHDFSWSVTKPDPKAHPGTKTGAIDLGVRISASLSIEGIVQAWHFEGRELLKDWDFVGGQIAREQAHIGDTRKGKAGYPPYARAIGALHAKQRQRLEHGLRVMAKDMATTCKHHGVSMVYLGWPKDIRRDRNYGSL